DWDLWLRLSLIGPVGISGLMGTEYLMRPGSISRNQPLRLACMKAIVARHAVDQSRFPRHAVRTAFARIGMGYAEHHRAQGAYCKAAVHHWRAFLRQPSFRLLRAALADTLACLGIKRK
ncbi:MAG: hypothetical protein U9N14_01230, partial [Pseudomonadota bacterium]|nr:hypothetical protein [Pseudomonadota bacterium]